MNLITNPKKKPMEGEKVGVCSLACSTLGVKWRVGALRCD